MTDFLEEMKRLQYEAALIAVRDCLRTHGDSQSCENFMNEFWYGSNGVFGTHDRDLPWATAEVIAGRCLTPQGSRELIVQAWTGPEFPEANLTQDLWLGIFGTVGFIADDDEDGQQEAPPDAPMRLWRGAIPSRARGMAWTSNRSRAEWFATRLDGVSSRERGALWTATAPPNTILARFTRRGEDEFVLDPRNLAIEEVPWEDAPQ